MVSDLPQRISRSLLQGVDADVNPPHKVKRWYQAASGAVESLASDASEWAEIKPTSDGDRRVLALGKSFVYVIVASHGASFGIQVRPIDVADGITLVSCIEHHDIDSRRRVWTFDVATDRVTLQTEQQNESDRVSTEERFARALARAKGWAVTDAVPNEIGPF
jgi:hypothetical protein